MLSPAPATPPLAPPNSLWGSSRSWYAHRHRPQALKHSPLCVCVEGRADLQDKLVPTGKREVSKSEGAPSQHTEESPPQPMSPTSESGALPRLSACFQVPAPLGGLHLRGKQ